MATHSTCARACAGYLSLVPKLHLGTHLLRQLYCRSEGKSIGAKWNFARCNEGSLPARFARPDNEVVRATRKGTAARDSGGYLLHPSPALCTTARRFPCAFWKPRVDRIRFRKRKIISIKGLETREMSWYNRCVLVLYEKSTYSIHPRIFVAGGRFALELERCWNVVCR